MNRRRRSMRGRAGAFSSAALAVALLVGAFSATALAAPPVNTAAPTISPSSPEIGKSVSATKGTWNSEAPLHWQNGSGTAFEEGKGIAVTPQSGPITFKASIGGSEGFVSCELNKFSNSSIQNPVGGGNGTGAFEIEFTECTTGGKWTSCTASFGEKVGATISLSKLEGTPKLTISPTGTSLGTFTLAGAKCAIMGSYKLVGVINGFYLSDLSRVEFTAASSGTGALRIGSKAGPKASAEGAIGLQNTETGEAVRLDPLTYGYQWKRCTGETCTEIGGATKSSYTPVAEDWGKTLKVTVTATDVNGSTPATSAASGVVLGTPNWYADNSGWQHLTSSPFTSSNLLEEGGEIEYDIKFTWGETLFHIGCGGSTGSGTMTNTGTQAKLEEYALTLTGCILWSPGCQLTSSELKFNTMTATSATGPTSTPSTKLTFAPNGVDVVSFSFKNCGGLVGPYRFVGMFPGTFVNSGSYVSHGYNEVKSAGTLKFQSSTGPVVSFEGVQRLLSEGHSVKLDAGA
ncbi:MAG TPA: hypothetical protein VIS51_08575 [Solirubrobacterales bacterium]